MMFGQGPVSKDVVSSSRLQVAGVQVPGVPATERALRALLRSLAKQWILHGGKGRLSFLWKGH